MKYSNRDKIDAYLKGELNEEEKQQFEKEIDKDEMLAQELHFHDMTQHHIELLEDRRITEQVKAIHQEELKKRKRKAVVKQIRYWVVAASILLVLALSWRLWNSPTTNPDALYAEYYTAYELPFGNRNEQNSLTEAGAFYLAGDYENAAPIMEGLLVSDPNLSKLQFALGICKMELEQWDQAIPLFEQLIKNKDVLYADNARWYLALCALKLNNPTTAIEQLEILKNAEGAVFQDNAVELLKSIK